jgi:NAD(P)-dependent dehydrogenase (short-subunit alcohol dehydrogenase family)
MKMDGKTVLVTGSTDGVGRHVAAKLAAAGAKVLIHGRDTLRAKTLTDEIRGQGYGAPPTSSGRSICSIRKRADPTRGGRL